MARSLKRRVPHQVGASPGTMVHMGERLSESVRIQILDFDEGHLEELEDPKLEDCLRFRDQSSITWINVEGLHDISMIETIGTHFGIHPLTLEDIVNTQQRPKVEEYDKYVFLILRMLDFETDILDEQLSLVLGENFVLSFQERPGDFFDPVRARIRGKNKGRIRKSGEDYLAYALIDAVVDHYFVVLEKLGDQIEQLGEQLVENPRESSIGRIHELRTKTILLRKSVWPMREVIGRLERSESEFFEESTLLFMRDVYDHTIQVMETVETFRDMAAGMLDLYLSVTSNRTNEVMKVLTIMASIFIPLTFVAGLYGMNFEYMPELHWKWGYYVALLIMLAIGLVMLLLFRKKKWI